MWPLATSCAKDYEGIHSCKPASQNRPIRSIVFEKRSWMISREGSSSFGIWQHYTSWNSATKNWPKEAHTHINVHYTELYLKIVGYLPCYGQSRRKQKMSECFKQMHTHAQCASMYSHSQHTGEITVYQTFVKTVVRLSLLPDNLLLLQVQITFLLSRQNSFLHSHSQPQGVITANIILPMLYRWD